MQIIYSQLILYNVCTRDAINGHRLLLQTRSIIIDNDCVVKTAKTGHYCYTSMFSKQNIAILN